MKRLQTVGLLAIAALLSLAWADTWKAVQSAAANVKTVQAEFVQEKHMPFLIEPLESRGLLFFEAPDSLRWEYLSPIRSVLSMHGGQVKRFVKDEQEGMTEDAGASMESFQVVLREITGWFAGRFTENPFFDARLLPSGKIELTPKSKEMTRMIRSIEIVLASTPGVIEAVIIREGEDSFTKIRFENTRINQPLPADIFKKIP